MFAHGPSDVRPVTWASSEPQQTRRAPHGNEDSPKSVRNRGVAILVSAGLLGVGKLVHRHFQPRADPGTDGAGWDLFISHVQRETKDIAIDAYYTFREKHGLKVWLDVKMAAQNVAAMERGIKNSKKVLVILSESFFTRPFCLKELRWARQYRKPLIVAVPIQLKSKIGFGPGELLEHCPDDLKDIINIDVVQLDRSKKEFFELGVKLLLKPDAVGYLEPPLLAKL
jgi:hypothetical protein